MPDNKPISEQAAERLLAALAATSLIDAEIDEQIDADLAGLLPANESAALHARLREDRQLAAIYRARQEELRAKLTPAYVAVAKMRIYERLRERFPVRRPDVPAKPVRPGAVEAFARRCSEALGELAAVFFHPVLVPTRGAHTFDPAVEESRDRSALFTTAARPGGGVRFTVTSYNAQDEGTQLEFSLHPAGSWRKTVTLARTVPGENVWEGMLELSTAEVQSLAGTSDREIRVRIL